jgi:hypothetical protein
MDRTAIIASLQQNHEAFIECIHTLPTGQWNASHQGKWSPAQQLDHILRSVGPVHMAMGLPKWFLRLAFGKPNRAARTFDALIERYKEKLTTGGRASGRFVPPATPTRSVEQMSSDLRKLVDKLNKRVNSWSDKDLDSMLLPHPLLGKLTMREMLYFTIYHAQHHQLIVERDYGQ